MKNIVKIAAAALLVAGAFSCTPKAEFQQYGGAKGFASMSVTSMGPAENVGSINIPVRLYAGKDVATTVSYKLIDGTAKSGVNYSVSGNGTLAFAAGDTLKNITVKIIDQPGVFTGALDFNVQISSATEDVIIGALNNVKVTIGDLDHPLTSLFGDYNMQAVTNSSSGYIIAKWTMAISQYDENPYRCWISNVIYFCSAYASYLDGPCKVYAEVSKDLKTITIPVPQTLGTTGANAFGDTNYFKIYAWDGTNANGKFNTDPKEIVYTLQEDGSYMTTDAFGMTNDEDIAAYGGSYYWSYMTNYSGFNSKYPNMFKKQ